jgi:hypothetical protein
MLPLHLHGKNSGSSALPSPRHIRHVSASSLSVCIELEWWLSGEGSGFAASTAGTSANHLEAGAPSLAAIVGRAGAAALSSLC